MRIQPAPSSGDAPKRSPPRGAGGRVAGRAKDPASPLAELTEPLAEAVAATGQPVVRLPSGAGHDAAIVAAIAPAAMLFVRCAGGVSHNPAEAVTVEDVAAAIEATTRFLELLG